jgi:hypothetical protein
MPAMLRGTLALVLLMVPVAFLPVGIAVLISSIVLCVGQHSSQKQCQD